MTERSLHTGQMIRRDAQTPEETKALPLKALPFTDTQALQAASPPSHTRSLVPVSALCPAPGFSPRLRTPNCSFQHLPHMALTMSSVTRILLILLLVPHSLTRLPALCMAVQSSSLTLPGWKGGRISTRAGKTRPCTFARIPGDPDSSVAPLCDNSWHSQPSPACRVPVSYMYASSHTAPWATLCQILDSPVQNLSGLSQITR